MTDVQPLDHETFIAGQMQVIIQLISINGLTAAGLNEVRQWLLSEYVITSTTGAVGNARAVLLSIVCQLLGDDEIDADAAALDRLIADLITLITTDD